MRVRRVAAAAWPVAVALASLLLLVREGKGSLRVVASNLPNPPWSTGQRIVDVVEPSVPPARVHHLTVGLVGQRTRTALVGARVWLQMASSERTRVVIVADAEADASRWRLLLGVLGGTARMHVVSDRGWLDLGALPADGSALRVQVVGVLPEPFSFAAIDRSVAVPGVVQVTLRSGGAAEDRLAALRYRLTRPDPLSARETFARATFFSRHGGILLAAAVAALIALIAGCHAVVARRATSAAILVAAGVTVLHAALLPPLQGADETSQVGTLEWIAFDPTPERRWYFPRSISLVAEALEQDRVQYQEEEALPLFSERRRGALSELLRSGLVAEARQEGAFPPAATVQVVSLKGPLFYAPMRWLSPLVRPLSVLDRLSLYRLIATAWSLAFFVAGALLLHRAAPPTWLYAYAALFLWPYAVGVSASCSNYAPAIGLGFLVAAATVSWIASDRAGARTAGAVCAVCAAWVGVPLWPDFAGTAVVVTVAAAVAMAARIVSRDGRRSGRAKVRRSFVSFLSLVALALAAAVVWRLFPSIDERIPKVLPRPGSASFTIAAVAVALPSALAAALAAVRWSLRLRSLEARVRLAWVASGVLATVLVVMFAVTPYHQVPYERAFLPLPQLIQSHLAAFWSNNFAWDQDRLGWRFFFGTFGWHDAPYPDAVYAIARWLSIAALAATPALTVPFAVERPRQASLLLVASGMAASLAVASLVVRHAMGVHPHGRFILPDLAPIALPVLVQIAIPGRETLLVRALLGLVALHVWTSVAVLGARYYFPG